MTDQELIKIAFEARENAYTPYSNFKVGACVLTKDGRIFKGCNIENSSYPVTICAERVAMFKAVSEGVKKDEIQALCIVADTPTPCSPCGACRQVMCELLPIDCRIVLSNKKGDIKVTSINELIPFCFSGKDMEK